MERGAASGPVVADDSATRIGFFPPRARFVGAVCALVGACAGIAGSLVASTPSPSSSRMLVVRTTPAGATVLWDDAPIAAVTPVVFTGPVQDGAHRLTVRLGSSPPISRTIDVAPQDTAVIVDEALEAGHTVRVETWPPGATLELDRRYVGKSPLELTDVSLAAPHTLVASAKGFRPSTTTIDARHPGRQHVVLRLEPHADVALVSVETSLAATVEVDGQPVGVAGPLPLPLGPHTFVVRAPALGIEKKLTATLSSTEPIKLFVSFH